MKLESFDVGDNSPELEYQSRSGVKKRQFDKDFRFGNRNDLCKCRHEAQLHHPPITDGNFDYELYRKTGQVVCGSCDCEKYVKEQFTKTENTAQRQELE